jgi:hypothetical protein
LGIAILDLTMAKKIFNNTIFIVYKECGGLDENVSSIYLKEVIWCLSKHRCEKAKS